MRFQAKLKSFSLCNLTVLHLQREDRLRLQFLVQGGSNMTGTICV